MLDIYPHDTSYVSPRALIGWLAVSRCDQLTNHYIIQSTDWLFVIVNTSSVLRISCTFCVMPTGQYLRQAIKTSDFEQALKCKFTYCSKYSWLSIGVHLWSVNLALRCSRADVACVVGVDIEHNHHVFCSFSKRLFLRLNFPVFNFSVDYLKYINNYSYCYGQTLMSKNTSYLCRQIFQLNF